MIWVKAKPLFIGYYLYPIRRDLYANLNPHRASPEDGFSFNDFKTNLDFRMMPSAVFQGNEIIL